MHFSSHSGILAKMKEGAETMHTKIQAKAESVGLKTFEKSGRCSMAARPPCPVGERYKEDALGF